MTEGVACVNHFSVNAEIPLASTKEKRGKQAKLNNEIIISSLFPLSISIFFKCLFLNRMDSIWVKKSVESSLWFKIIVLYEKWLFDQQNIAVLNLDCGFLVWYPLKLAN